MKSNLFKRELIIECLQTTKCWDVIVIGGGATGLGVALDSATRGFKTLLLEQVDYAKGTSSRSTKLVHGGVRYLAQGDVGLVKEALYERGLLMKNAFHLVSNQSFVIPSYGVKDSVKYTIGLKLYDFLAGKLSFGNSKFISKKETKNRLQTLDNDKLKGGIVYHDGQFDDSRLAVNLAQSCLEQGATVLNHFEVTELLKNKKGEVEGVVAKDAETQKQYRLNSKMVVNATGVFTDHILKMDNKNASNMIKPSQGIHLVVDKSFLPGNDAIMIPKTDDGRVLFLVPWHNRVLIGTTDTVLDSHSLEPVALEEEIDFVIRTANKYLSKKIGRENVLSIFAGLRPLAASQGNSEKTKEISRSHKIIVSKSKLVTITGGKWTTYRRMAQDTIDKVIKTGGFPKRACKTNSLLIHGAAGLNGIKLNDALSVYGSDCKHILELIEQKPDLGERLHSRFSYTKAEVVWAVRYEMARTVEDVLARRVRVLFLDAKAAIEIAPNVAAIIAAELGKDLDWQENQIYEFNLLASNYLLNKGGEEIVSNC